MECGILTPQHHAIYIYNKAQDSTPVELRVSCVGVYLYVCRYVYSIRVDTAAAVSPPTSHLLDLPLARAHSSQWAVELEQEQRAASSEQRAALCHVSCCCGCGMGYLYTRNSNSIIACARARTRIEQPPHERISLLLDRQYFCIFTLHKIRVGYV